MQEPNLTEISDKVYINILTMCVCSYTHTHSHIYS